MFFRRHSSAATSPGKSTRRRTSRPNRRATWANRRLSLESLERREVLAAFQPMGPAPIIHGGTEKVSPDNEVSGAIHTVVAHPTNANVMYIGAVNGGIWKTTNATAERPHWVPLTDDLPSLSIGAMAMDPNDSSRLVAGTGRYSAFAEGGALSGLMLTEDAGATWQVIRDPLLVGKNISGVAINGDLILVSAGGGFYFSEPKPERSGLFRSQDGGATWENVELFPRDANFPDEPINFEVFDLVADPTDPLRYYVGVADEGIFRTDDGGTNWTNVTAGDPRIDQLLQIIDTNDLDLNNMEMAVANNGRIYAAVITLGQPLYIGYSDSFGGAWTEMDVPLTLETTGVVGISPDPEPGGQGNLHFSIAADPNDPYTVYVGGDTQVGDLSFQYGNSIGARDFTGRLFRGDTRKTSIGNVLNLAGFIPFNGYSPQWEHLTHSNVAFDRVFTFQPIMPEGGTRRGSAPHADSREITFDANGQLIQVDDGGIYRRTSPLNNQGDWYSINGDLQVTEIHSIAYDSNSNTLLGGSQDNGAVQQLDASGKVWEVVEVINQSIVGAVIRSSPGDGGDVAIDDTSIPGHSVRYFSAQGLSAFRRQVYDANNNLISEDELTPGIIGNFVTPVVLNANNPSRIAVGGMFGIFESFDRGDGFREILGPQNVSFGVIGTSQVAMEYGGQRNGVANPAVLYVGSEGEVFVRTQQDQNMRLTRAQFPGGFVWDIALDTADWANAYVIDRDDVYVTTNVGDSWRKITGNLAAVGGGELRTIEFVRKGSGTGFVVVGTNTGTFVTSDANPGQWSEVGNLPNAPVFDMEYDVKDDVLAVGTMGRGAFVLRDAYNTVSGATGAGQQRSARGTIWNDLNGDGTRDANEPALPGVTVYVDVNSDGLFGIGEPTGVSGANGAYTIANIPNGRFTVSAVVQAGWVQTKPANDQGYLVNFANQTPVTNLDFGIREGRGEDAGFDFGDAPAPFPTLLANNGASHGIVAGFQLGQRIDGDLNGQPSPGADGDDNNTVDDEDGVTFVSDLIPGSAATIEVLVQNGTQPPGVLQGWIDFDGDGAWNTPGEQVFRDLVVTAGRNQLTINVPSWAELGETYARFRYGYERGISYRGRAIAGEVEDYTVEIIKGGPTAVDDNFVVRRNSVDNQLNVLTNDTLPPGSNTVISAVSAASAGGSVRVAANGGSLIYTPKAGFSGTETMVYTLRDRNGLTDSATVAVFVQPDLASIRLGAALANGTPITSVNVGQTFLLQGFVQDLSPASDGVFAAYLDVVYSGAGASVQGTVTYGPEYPNGQSGATNVPGLIDEVGAFDGIDPLGPNEMLLFSVPMRADQGGTITFSGDPADVLPSHHVLLFGRTDPVPIDQIEYRGLTLSVVQPLAARTNPRNPLDVNDDTDISPLDALLVINELNDNTPSLQAEREPEPLYLDVNADGSVSPLDALLVINELNRAEPARAQAAPLAAIAAALDAQPLGSATTDDPQPIGELFATDSTSAKPLDVVSIAHERVFASLDGAAADSTLADASTDDLDAVLAQFADELK